MRSREERLFGAACLKLKLAEIEVGGAREVYLETLRDLELTEAEVDAYLSSGEQRTKILASLRSKGDRPS